MPTTKRQTDANSRIVDTIRRQRDAAAYQAILGKTRPRKDPLGLNTPTFVFVKGR